MCPLTKGGMTRIVFTSQLQNQQGEKIKNSDDKTVNQLVIKQENINRQCMEIARTNGLLSETVAGPLFDGVADEALYLRTKPKVLWILQEPHDTQHLPQGNWSVPKEVIQKEDYGFGNQTHEAIAKTMYAFRNGISFEKVNKKYQKNDDFRWTVMGALKDIAWINVSKMPCPTRTKAYLPRIEKAYKLYWRSIVIEQVQQIYQPNIIVVAGAHWHFVADDIAEGSLRQLAGYDDQVAHWIDSAGRHFLWVDHPAKPGTKCFDIWVKAIKNCINSK